MEKLCTAQQLGGIFASNSIYIVMDLFLFYNSSQKYYVLCMYGPNINYFLNIAI